MQTLPAGNPPRDSIMSALADVIASAPERERNILAQAMQDYAERYSRSWKDLRHSRAAFFRDLLDTIVETTDARIAEPPAPRHCALCREGVRHLACDWGPHR